MHNISLNCTQCTFTFFMYCTVWTYIVHRTSRLYTPHLCIVHCLVLLILIKFCKIFIIILESFFCVNHSFSLFIHPFLIHSYNGYIIYSRKSYLFDFIWLLTVGWLFFLKSYFVKLPKRRFRSSKQESDQ